VPPRLSYHVVHAADDGVVHAITPISSAGIRINGGFFVFRGRIFDELRPGEDLVEVIARLAAEGSMIAFPYDGFWAAMDTPKDKQHLDEVAARGVVPWLAPPEADVRGVACSG
jgi:glucose-1-phosphate cytidylyltransferase